MAVNWPATLPGLNELTDYQETPPDLLLRHSMDVGPPKVRRRSSAGIRPISGYLVITLAQVDILDGYYLSDLAGGSIPGAHTHPRTGVSIEFLIVTPPVYRRHRGLWRADLSIEVLP